MSKIVLIGSGERQVMPHVQIVERVEGIELDGYLFDSTAAWRRDLLAREEVRGVVVLTPLEERAFAIGQALAAGKDVLCSQPVGRNWKEVKKLQETARQRGRSLCVMAPRIASPVSRVMQREYRRDLGRLLFFDLRISISGKRVAEEREGVLLLHAIPYLGRLEEAFGSVDSVFARTRSLWRNRPAEDLALLLFRFLDGLEGIVQVTGWGEVDQVELRLFGRNGSRCVRSGDGGGEEEWRRLEQWYSNFAKVLSAEEEPMWDGGREERGFFLWDWIQQSARVEREIFRKEVIRA